MPFARGDTGANVLLEAYRSLAPSPTLVVIGKATPEAPASLPQGAVFLRDWPNAAVRAAMRRCLALVVPSVWAEPFGIVAPESLAAGRPVVASGTGGPTEIVRDGREGLLVPPGDAGALASALRAHRRRRRPSRGHGAARAAERAGRFAPEVALPRVEAAYREVLASASTGR
jgi:glycosyltransferase involved in cell wall biosynthesis